MNAEQISDLKNCRLWNTIAGQRTIANLLHTYIGSYPSFAGMTESAIYAAIRRHDSRVRTMIPGKNRAYASV